VNKTEIEAEQLAIRSKIGELKLQLKALDKERQLIVLAEQEEHRVKMASKRPVRTPAARQEGAGKELHALLARIGQKMKPGCKCNERMGIMNRNGPDWCELHREEIVGWLKEEAERQGTSWGPAKQAVAWVIVGRAIKRARKRTKATPEAPKIPHMETSG